MNTSKPPSGSEREQAPATSDEEQLAPPGEPSLAPPEAEEGGNRLGLLVLVAIPLIPVGYGVGTLVVEAFRDWLP